MNDNPGAAPVQTARELKAQIEAERAGVPFLIYRDGSEDQRIFVLGDELDRVTVGRAGTTDISVEWDTEVSRLHAELERIGGDWTVADDGLSRNGTHVNGERVVGRRRLADRDVIRFGKTVATYRQPLAADLGETEVATGVLDRASLTEAQRRVLIALCRPFKDSSGYVTPATNQQIADELFLSIDAVKTHLRALFAKFGIEDLPQNQKRVRLVELALKSGVVSPRDL
ncbi:MAG TPA: FHA domain-containing protein [Solirubrobacteraceae bacterium]|nr:FHA domain-containing protein [Solirubrobacteraceae bacterium]